MACWEYLVVVLTLCLPGAAPESISVNNSSVLQSSPEPTPNTSEPIVELYESQDGIINNPAVPLVTAIPGGMFVGRTVYIAGITHGDAKRVTINLAAGPQPDGSDKVLQFDIRFDALKAHNVVVLNSKLYGNWGPEEKPSASFPFAKGQRMEISITATSNFFKILVNGQFYTNYNYRLPLQRATYLIVVGDVSLSKVSF